MATKKPTAAQLAARKLFAARVRAGEFSGAAKRKRNPLSRVKVNSPPQRPAGNDDAPSARLKSRRRKTAKISQKGYYANPAPAKYTWVGVRVNAGNDRNGNSRRGVLVVRIMDGVYPEYKAFVPMRYQSADQSLIEAGFDQEIAVIGEFEISPTVFKKLQQTYPAK